MNKELRNIAKYIKDNTPVKALCEKLEISENKLYGIIELMILDGIDIDIVTENGVPTIKRKLIYRTDKNIKESFSSSELELISLCVVSDTHLGVKTQQLTLLNQVYEEAHRRGIKTFLHCGDLLEGDYRDKRKAHPYQVFLQGFDQQVEYAAEMYPQIDGCNTYFIQGSHDETHFINGGATPGLWLSKQRSDMHHLGNTRAFFYAGTKENVKIEMFHPGKGSAKAYSYNSQEKTNKMDSGYKPKVLLTGHYHKCFYMFYRNVHSFLIPCFMDKSGFMIENDLVNTIGAYFIDLYVNNKGEVQFISPEEYLFKPKDYIEDDYKKCKKLVIK